MTVAPTQPSTSGAIPTGNRGELLQEVCTSAFRGAAGEGM
jgi:hypothetical protein